MTSASEVVRARLLFSYDGTDFAGWAIQPKLRTVQGELEAALAKVVRPSRGLLRPVVAGRTDAGVHARGQVAHVDIDREAWERLPGRADRTPERGLRDRLDAVLPDDVVVVSAQEAPPGFDARFSALGRRYAYRVDDSGAPDPLRRRHVAAWGQRLDVEALNEATATLSGLRDFAPFCRPRPGATTIRELDEFTWERVTDGPDAGLVVATLRADAFCHSMVRSLVGAVLPVGEGRRDLGWLAEVAANKRRAQIVSVAPARGLTLEHVAYPPDDEVGARADLTRARRSLD